MKILEIIPTLSSGGGERFVVDLANELSRENNVTLLVFRLDGNLSFYLPQVSENVRVILIKKHSGLDLRLFFKVFRTNGIPRYNSHTFKRIALFFFC